MSFEVPWVVLEISRCYVCIRGRLAAVLLAAVMLVSEAGFVPLFLSETEEFEGPVCKV